VGKSAGFVVGLIVGAGAGAGGALLLNGGAGQAPAQLTAAAPGVDWRAEAARLSAELHAVRAAGTEGGVAPAGRVPTPGSAGAQPESGSPAAGTAAEAEEAEPSTTPLTPEEAAAQQAKDKAKARKREVKALRKRLQQELRELRDAEPGSEAVLQRIAEWRELAKGDDADFAKYASRALLFLARGGKLRPEDAPALAEDFATLPEGAAGRPGLAGAVARAWAEDERLGGWLSGLPSPGESGVRETAIWALDESPSDPYREWVLQLARSEPDPEVIDSVYDEDIVAVTLTRQTASRWIEAVEPRVAEGGLTPKTRARAYFALGLVGQQDPDGAKASLARLAEAERDPAVRAFAQGVVALIAKDASNVQALEGLWDRHRPDFGKE
jgi:hypothetical protein